MNFQSKEMLSSLAKLSRQLTSSRDSWNDRTRSQFDRRYFDPILSEGDVIAKRLSDIEAQIADALRALAQSD